MISEEFLAILRCPQNSTPLHKADAGLLEQVNRRIAAGAVTNQSGQPVKSPLSEALVREDKQVLYPVMDDLPILLADEAIPLDRLDLHAA